MIRLSDSLLPSDTQAGLDGLQKEITNLKTYKQQVQKAKDLFSRRNNKHDTIFKVVRRELEKMCTGPRRCAYCEDSAADEVEHFKPKDLYPEMVFVWLNYLYACGPCNGPKNNQFGVFSQATGLVIDITRKRNDPIVPPEPGNTVLIDPRSENPLDFLQLDLLNTFYFIPVGKLGTEKYQRGNYTIKLLRLNEREYLRVARQNAYESFVALLEKYTYKQKNGSTQPELDRIKRTIQRMSHQTVWQEMKRRHLVMPELKALFTKAHEALNW